VYTDDELVGGDGRPRGRRGLTFGWVDGRRRAAVFPRRIITSRRHYHLTRYSDTVISFIHLHTHNTSKNMSPIEGEGETAVGVLASAKYGKDKVRVFRVVRDATSKVHDVVEYNVTVLVEGAIETRCGPRCIIDRYTSFKPCWQQLHASR
jgi:hypothetical protein